MPIAVRTISAALLVLAACRAQPPTPAEAAADLFEGYRIDRPDTVLMLPDALREVSGLVWGPRGALEAVYDEAGLLYRFEGGMWRDVGRFAGEGDFEGVAYVGNDLYVLRSDGVLITPRGEVRLGTPEGCDAEGLGYDAQGRRLLVACKGLGRSSRAIYAWDPATRRLAPEPVVRIPANLGRTEGRAARLLKLNRLDRFRPSGVDVAPDGRIYVLSSLVQALAVFNRQGQLVAAVGLDDDVLSQPEGLAFGPDGTLYISSEAGNNGRPVVAVYRRH